MEKFVFVDQETGKRREALVEARPVCADCREQSPAGRLGNSEFKRRLNLQTMKLQLLCARCGKELAEYPVAEMEE